MDKNEKYDNCRQMEEDEAKREWVEKWQKGVEGAEGA